MASFRTSLLALLFHEFWHHNIGNEMKKKIENRFQRHSHRDEKNQIKGSFDAVPEHVDSHCNTTKRAKIKEHQCPRHRYRPSQISGSNYRQAVP